MIDRVGDKCCGCGACASVCPRQCIAMRANEEGFAYPDVNTNNCVECGACVKVCPVQRQDRDHVGEPLEAWGVVAQDDSLLTKSSSGGLFSLLANMILEEGGIVYGAAFSDDFTGVHHIGVERTEELFRLRGSKYVQSDLNDIYTDVRIALNAGRRVLFSGTPCQIAGLTGFLGREYDALLTIEVLCHGVPSPLLWERYVENCGKGRKVMNVSFRDKRRGWENYGLSIDYEEYAY